MLLDRVRNWSPRTTSKGVKKKEASKEDETNGLTQSKTQPDTTVVFATRLRLKDKVILTCIKTQTAASHRQ